MHANIVYGHIQPGKMDEYVNILRDFVGPVITQAQGFRGGFVLTDTNTNRAISAVLWETEADLTALDTSAYQQQVAKLPDLLAEPRVMEFYEVSAQEPITAAKYARVGTGQVQPGRMAETIRIMRDTNQPAYRKHQGFKGAMLLTNDNTGKAISITLWETEADIRASDARLQGQRERVRQTQTSTPLVEHYEVSVQM